MKPKSLTIKKRKDAPPVPGPEGPEGPQGPVGPRGFEGLPGKPGAERFVELRDVPSSYSKQGGRFVRVSLEEDQIEFVDPPAAGTVFVGTGGGGVGPQGPPGPEGPEGPPGESVPRSTTIVRDASGRILSAAVEGGSTWTVARNAAGNVASLTDSSTTVDVIRDAEGTVLGTEVSEP